jgi:ABC-type nitrate/sulfonate/bicarbonate transport system substrate-binding protein
MRIQTVQKIVLAACLVMPTFALLSSSAYAADKVTVGIIPITDCAPIVLGKQKASSPSQHRPQY